MKKVILFAILMLMPILASADVVEINGIYYNLNNDGNVAEVTRNPNKYTGSIVIPESVDYNDVTYRVTSIGLGAFQNCTGLTSIDIPNSVMSIGNVAFQSCTGLTSITIPNSVTNIGSGAFHNTAWYNNQPEGLVYLENVAYIYKGTMPSNTSITLNEGTVAIAATAFNGCIGLTSIDIPNSVTSIGDAAFQSCTGLTSIVIPNSVTSIGQEAFQYCGLSSITIGNNVTSIGNSAFGGCIGLTSITIPNSVTSVGESAFGYCTGLKKISVHSNRPPSATSAITTQDVYDNCTLYIPEGSENIYYASTFWNAFKTIKMIDAVEKVPQDVNGDGIVDTQDVLEIYKYIQEH